MTNYNLILPFTNIKFNVRYFVCTQIKYLFTIAMRVLTSLSMFAYSQTLSIETALVSISHALRTQKLRL